MWVQDKGDISGLACGGAGACGRRGAGVRMEIAEGGGRVEDIRQASEDKKLYRALMKSLKDRGLKRLPYTDMVEQYMSFWCDVRRAQEDIDAQGLQILDERRGTPIANPSCTVKRQASDAMRKLFATLGFEAEAKRAAASGEDDDEL